MRKSDWSDTIARLAEKYSVSSKLKIISWKRPKISKDHKEVTNTIEIKPNSLSLIFKER